MTDLLITVTPNKLLYAAPGFCQLQVVPVRKMNPRSEAVIVAAILSETQSAGVRRAAQRAVAPAHAGSPIGHPASARPRRAAAATARSISWSRPSGPISTSSAAAVVPPGD